MPAVTEIRILFGTTLVELSALLSQWPLAERFDRPSALPEFSVRGLAGHLLRAMTSVETYLDRPEPVAGGGAGVEVRSAAGYYAAIVPAHTDLDSDFHRAIRQRGLEAARGAPIDFRIEWAETAARLINRLEDEPEDRLVQVYGDHVLSLDDYLVTRLIELVVHADDLAASLGVPAPALPAAATGLAIATLVEVARIRHGETAVLRALTRRERDTADALRVL